MLATATRNDFNSNLRYGLMRGWKRFPVLVLALVGWCGVSAYITSNNPNLIELYWLWGSSLPLPTQLFYDSATTIQIFSIVIVLFLVSKEFWLSCDKRLPWALMGIVSALVVFSCYLWSMMLPVSAHGEFVVGIRSGAIICKKNSERIACGVKERMMSFIGEEIKPQMEWPQL